ncbi:MAG: hypothetical protein DWI48_05715 [Chloroflexi bacterium]|nr:MAG: hypothetical protein DWI48_05715 [Chloroflexota bacterium]
MGGLLIAWRTPLIALFLIGGGLSGAGYAFAAANTTPTSRAGDGAAVITGYTVSSVVYAIGVASPQNIDTVTFNLDSTPPVGSKIRLKLVAAGATWYTCSNVAAAITCDTTVPQATVASADELRVVVAQ